MQIIVGKLYNNEFIYVSKKHLSVSKITLPHNTYKYDKSRLFISYKIATFGLINNAVKSDDNNFIDT